MTSDGLIALLNELLEAERAGARLLADWMAEAPAGSALHEALEAVQRDEAENCAVLMRHIRDAGATPSAATGAFYAKALAVQGWRERLALLNRGQGWVAKRIAAALPELSPSPSRAMLEAMLDSHVANIARCESLPV